MKLTKYYLVIRIFSTILAFIAIGLQFYALFDLETELATYFSSSIALAISIYISMILCFISFTKTAKILEQYHESI